MYINMTWDYPAMASCANSLDGLKELSDANKKTMDAAFDKLAIGAQSEVGKAFIAAYSEHVASIQMFAEILQSEAELLRNNSNAMQEADEEIATQVRSQFSL